VKPAGRSLLLLGCLLFVASCFLPPGAMHSPAGMFKWTMEAVSTSDSNGEALAYGGAAFVIAYPYLWAILVVITALRSLGQSAGRPWIHVGILSLGGVVLTALIVMLALLHDPWLRLPVWGQWIAAIVPVVILVPMWMVAIRGAKQSRTWLVIGLGFLPQCLLQIAMAFISVGRAGHAWGFVIGSVGCLLALTGSASLVADERRRLG
jgi:hypothetical protein